jgi:hypothetical protein
MRTRFVLVFAFSIFAAGVTSAQQPQPCPQVTINSQDGPVGWDGARVFHAQLVGAIPGKDVYFNWSGSYGQYLTDNGLPSITIRPSSSIDERPSRDSAVYVDVLGEGIPRGCRVQDYVLVGLKGFSLASPYFDQYHDFAGEQETLHLENFVKELNADPEARAFVVIEDEIDADLVGVVGHMHNIRRFLTDQRGIAETRVTIVLGRPLDYPSVRLWVVPPGSELPDAADDW